MAGQDVITKSYRSLNSLELAIRAFVEVAHLMPEEERYASLLLVLADRLEREFAVVSNDTIHLWHPAAKEEMEERA